VHLKRTPALPPKVILERVISVREGAEPGPVRTIMAGKPIVIDVPRVRVEGRIAGAAALSEAEWDDDAASRRLSAFIPNRAATFAVSEVIDLTPGAQSFRFRARVADGAFAEVRLVIEYRPPLPSLVEMTLDPPGPVAYYQGREAGPPLVRMKARLSTPVDAHPFKGTVMVNDRARPEGPVLDGPASLLIAEFPLDPGDNQIRLRMENAWNSTWTSEPVCVTYRRPPRINPLVRSEVGSEPFVEIGATVDSPDDLPLTRVQVEVRGAEPGGAVRSIRPAEFRREGTSWIATASAVPIEPGENMIRVVAWNADGSCQEPASLAGLVYRAPPTPRPEVAILDPGCDGTVDLPSIPLAFRVLSSSPLKKVELVRVLSTSEREVLSIVDPAGARRNEQGVFELRDTRSVPLKHQSNLLQLVAINSGGEASTQVSVSYIPSPVRIVIDRLVPDARGEPVIVTAGWEGERNDFAAHLQGGKVTVVGRVIWPDPETRVKIDEARVRIWVNGFPHANAELRPRVGHDLEAEFQAPVLLNRKANRIAVKLPEVVLEACDLSELRVACAHPERQQRLHLLIVGVGQDDDDALREQALNAFEGTLLEGSKTAFKTPAFSQGQIYGPLTHDVRKSQIVTQLGRIKLAINPNHPAADAPNEVVFVCYQGEEWVEGKRSFLRLRPVPRPGPNDLIAVDEMVAFFAEMRGAQFWVLDVIRSTSSRPVIIGGTRPPPRPESTAGLLRFSWVRPTDVPATDPPSNARLLTAMDEAMPGAPTVKDLVTEVSKKHAQLEKIYPNLNFDRYLPDILADLVIGTPADP
jgi:hypothetical protein